MGEALLEGVGGDVGEDFRADLAAHAAEVEAQHEEEFVLVGGDVANGEEWRGDAGMEGKPSRSGVLRASVISFEVSPGTKPLG